MDHSSHQGHRVGAASAVPVTLVRVSIYAYGYVPVSKVPVDAGDIGSPGAGVTESLTSEPGTELRSPGRAAHALNC